MKNFKDILSEVAVEPKSAEERRFKDMHTIELIKHPVAPDHVFTGEIEGIENGARLADQMPGEDEMNYDQAYDVKDEPFKMPRNIDENSTLTFSGLLERVMLDEEDHSDFIAEDPSREVPMMQRQLEFICYAAEEIREYIEQDGVDPEEWYQNKLANAFSMMKTLHAYAEGEKRVNTIAAAYRYEEVETDLEEGMEEGKRGFIMAARAAKEAGDKEFVFAGKTYNVEEVFGEELEENSKEFQQEIDMVANMIKKGEHERLAKMIKRDAKLKGGGGWNMAQKPSKEQKAEYNKMVRDHKKKHPKLYEDFEGTVELEEANFKPGNMKLKDGSTVKISMDDAKAITTVMKTLNPKNRKEMEDRMMKDKKGFSEILTFAKTV